MPKLKISRAFKPVVTRPKRFIVLVGGRGSGKSIAVADILTMRMHTEAADVLCLREFQNSIDDSVHKLFKDRVFEHGIRCSVTENRVTFPGGNGTRYRGAARNPDSLQSAQGFKYCWFEEAHTISQTSLDKLLPTIRANDSSLIFTANPQSSEDPFSKRFINPYLSELDSAGIYEDDLHLIIKVDYRDNPWFPESLESQRKWDYENFPRAKYDHIWLGAYNDSIENSLILAEWFDSCVDAHKKLGFKAQGGVFAAHDPSDQGGDTKGYAQRHGSVVTHVEEMTSGDVNEGCDWALGMARAARVDSYCWDADGMGAALNRQTAEAFKNTHTVVFQFKGSEAPDNKMSIYEPTADSGIQGQKTVGDIFRNKRAQNYFALRDRVYRTYRAVEHGEHYDPEDLISFSSEITELAKLRAELCRLPVKPNANGFFELYTKEAMLRKFQVASPNLADSVMMLMISRPRQTQRYKMPQPVGVIGRGQGTSIRGR